MNFQDPHHFYAFIKIVAGVNVLLILYVGYKLAMKLAAPSKIEAEPEQYWPTEKEGL